MDVSEESLRQALARLGGGNRQPRPSGGNTPGTGAAPARGAQGRSGLGGTLHASGGDPRQDGRRRRFVQDGQVIVEHQNQRPSARGSAAAQEDHDEIERLKQSVRREQRRCEEETRALSDARNTIRGLETRIAHADLHLREMEGQLRARDERIAELTLALREAQGLQASTHAPAQVAARADIAVVAEDETGERASGAPSAAPRRHARPGRPAKLVEAGAGFADEPEPVKWWIKG